MEKKIYQIAKKALPNALFSVLSKDSGNEFSFKIAPEPTKTIFVDMSITQGILYIYVVYATILMHGKDLRQQKMFSGAAPLLADGSLNEGFFELLFIHYSSFGR